MKPIEIERLLQWAFCVELPKRRGLGPSGARSAWASIENYGRLGCRVNSSPATSYGATPHRDALTVADEVATLRGSVSIDFHKWKRFLLGDLVNLVDGTADLTINVSEVDLVEEHARERVTPDWFRNSPKASPVIGPNGKQRVCGKRYGKDRYSDGAFCPLRWGDPTIISIARARAEYTVWRGALDRLVKCLNGKLKDYAASAPAALPAPWARPQ